MVSALPGERERVRGELAFLACLEAWLVHMRLLIEFFLIRKTSSTKDFSARDFGWPGSHTADHGELRELWHAASSHLVHFGGDRAPEDLYELVPQDTSHAALVKWSSQLLAIAEEFVFYLEQEGTSEADRFRRSLTKAQSNLLGP